MKKQIRIAAIIAATLFSANALAQDGQKHPDLAAGKKMYNTWGCSECHGYVGQGGLAGATLLLPSNLQTFIAQLRSPKAVMPPYMPSVLSDDQAADIYAYTQTFPKPVDYKTIKLLQQ